MAWLKCLGRKPDKTVSINQSTPLTYYEGSTWGANPAYISQTINCSGYKYAYVDCELSVRKQYNNTAGGVSNTIYVGIGNTSHITALGTVSGAPSGGGTPSSYPSGRLTRKIDISDLSGNQQVLGYQGKYDWDGAIDGTLTVYQIRLSDY